MEVRSAESAAVEAPAPESVREPDAPAARTSSRTRRRSSQVAAPKAAILTRVQEYAYIRSDMRRMLITAGSLLAAMLVLLVLIE